MDVWEEKTDGAECMRFVDGVNMTLPVDKCRSIIPIHLDRCNSAGSRDTKFKKRNWWIAGRGSYLDVGPEFIHCNSKSPHTGVNRAEDCASTVRDVPGIGGALQLKIREVGVFLKNSRKDVIRKVVDCSALVHVSWYSSQERRHRRCGGRLGRH